MPKLNVPQSAPTIKLVHPETKETKVFTLEHAQRVFDYQTKRRAGADKAWSIADGESYKLKDGKIISGSDKPDSK